MDKNQYLFCGIKVCAIVDGIILGVPLILCLLGEMTEMVDSLLSDKLGVFPIFFWIAFSTLPITCLLPHIIAGFSSENKKLLNVSGIISTLLSVPIIYFAYKILIGLSDDIGVYMYKGRLYTLGFCIADLALILLIRELCYEIKHRKEYF